jgi:hypothetical protein
MISDLSRTYRARWSVINWLLPFKIRTLRQHIHCFDNWVIDFRIVPLVRCNICRPSVELAGCIENTRETDSNGNGITSLIFLERKQIALSIRSHKKKSENYRRSGSFFTKFFYYFSYLILYLYYCLFFQIYLTQSLLLFSLLSIDGNKIYRSYADGQCIVWIFYAGNNFKSTSGFHCSESRNETFVVCCFHSYFFMLYDTKAPRYFRGLLVSTVDLEFLFRRGTMVYLAFHLLNYAAYTSKYIAPLLILLLWHILGYFLENPWHNTI